MILCSVLSVSTALQLSVWKGREVQKQSHTVTFKLLQTGILDLFS